MLELKKFISKGATRICFEHPNDENLCVKVIVRFKDDKILYKELKAYNYIKDELKDYIVWYDEKVVDTNLGKAVICKLLRDENKEYSKPLSYYKNEIDDEIKTQLWHFAYKLIEHDIFFYDFNLNNFVIQINNGKKKLYYTDIKSFERYKPLTFLRLERVIPQLARYLMIKRLKKIFKNIGITKNVN